MTGYWFLDAPANWQPPAGLEHFLTAGSTPIYVGFGSMANRDAVRTTHVVIDAVRRAGQRAVLAGARQSAQLQQMPESVFLVDDIPHDWLLPRVAAAVHHAGAGTTGASLRAGVPTVTVPFFADQPFWAERVWFLGAGPRPIPRRQLSAERLAQAIEAATSDQALRRRAVELGVRIRNEDGVGRAVELFQRIVAACGRAGPV